MCLFNTPQMPTQAAIPRTPQPDSDIAVRRGDEARRLASARGGSASNIVSDLAPTDVVGAKPKAVLLGQ